jgi:hypothetical protein
MVMLIDRWRRMVADTGSDHWDDDTAQEVIDAHRLDIYREPLVAVPQPAPGSTVYTVYQAQYPYIEGTASGSAVFRLYDAGGTAITSGFTLDWQRGRVVFSADQGGSARLLDYRAYDLNAAAADGWRERAADTADKYAFADTGQSFSRNQWFEHCERMAERYAAQAWVSAADIVRSDVNA